MSETQTATAAAQPAVSAAAQLCEAENLIAYFRSRTAWLAQHIIDRDAAAASLADTHKREVIELKATIAGLEDALRVARSEADETMKEDTHGE